MLSAHVAAIQNGWSADFAGTQQISSGQEFSERRIASSIPKQVVRAFDNSVFEVVIKKIDPNFVTFEGPLRLDLIPYSQRVDRYESIGTAFAISGGVLLSAAHVFEIPLESNVDAIFIRDKNGKVYPVNQIYQYNRQRDYVLFSVGGAAKFQGLKLNSANQLNSRVFTVGNALGKGVVVRDGLLTSRLHEDKNGEWQWLAFSAPASPGNSGGPLLDEQGRVLGIVVLKSENENLNYALPVSEVSLKKSGASGELNKHNYFKLVNTVRTTWVDKTLKFSLPRNFVDFSSDYRTQLSRYYHDLITALRKEHGAFLFPFGAGSAAVLGQSARAHDFPELAMENDNQWNYYLPKKMRTVNLEEGGKISFGTIGELNEVFYEPSSQKLMGEKDAGAKDGGALSGDLSSLMDRYAPALQLSVIIGATQTPIKSLGKPFWGKNYRDSYGRTWFTNAWNFPVSSQVILTSSLVLPQGVFSFLILSPKNHYLEYVELLEFYSDFLFPHYKGSSKQWEAYLSQPKNWIPDVFDSTQVSEAEGHLVFKNSNFSVKFPDKNEKSLNVPILEARVVPVISNSQSFLYLNEVGVSGLPLAGDYSYVTRFGKGTRPQDDFVFSSASGDLDKYLDYGRLVKGLRGLSDEVWQNTRVLYQVGVNRKGSLSKQDLMPVVDQLEKGLEIHEPLFNLN